MPFGAVTRTLVGFVVAYGLPIFLLPKLPRWTNALHEWWWRGNTGVPRTL